MASSPARSLQRTQDAAWTTISGADPVEVSPPHVQPDPLPRFQDLFVTPGRLSLHLFSKLSVQGPLYPGVISAVGLNSKGRGERGQNSDPGSGGPDRHSRSAGEGQRGGPGVVSGGGAVTPQEGGVAVGAGELTR